MDSDALRSIKDRIRDEAMALGRARHGHILKIITTYFYNKPGYINFSIIMEFAEGESLLEYLYVREQPARGVVWMPDRCCRPYPQARTSAHGYKSRKASLIKRETGSLWRTST